jgi:hypothetical protein
MVNRAATNARNDAMKALLVAVARHCRKKAEMVQAVWGSSGVTAEHASEHDSSTAGRILLKSTTLTELTTMGTQIR